MSKKSRCITHRILQDAESDILDKLTGVLESLQHLTEIRLQRLRVSAGRSRHDGSRSGSCLQGERVFALETNDEIMKIIHDYPPAWDRDALFQYCEVVSLDDIHDLRRRVFITIESTKRSQ